MPRVSVPISEDTKLEVIEHPDELGLDPDSSEAQRFGELVEAGAAARRAQVKHERRVAAYVEHNADHEYEQALKVSTDAAFERGGF